MRVLNWWVEKLNQALANGYNGLRLLISWESASYARLPPSFLVLSVIFFIELIPKPISSLIFRIFQITFMVINSVGHSKKCIQRSKF
jgi:hypothetical protein